MASMDPALIAERLGLGRPLRPAEVLKVDELQPVWKVETASGSWVLKTIRPAGDFWYGVAAQAGAFEAAAWHSGLDMPEPYLPETDAVGLWVKVDEGPVEKPLYAKAARFLEGAHATPPLNAPLAEWAGGTVAALERLGIEADPAVDTYETLQLQSDWDIWLGEGRDLGVLDAAQARALKDAAVRIAEIVRPALASKPVDLVMHRDFSYLNILVTSEGPRLLDFDSAGAKVPWWELVAVAFELAAPDLGVMRPERRTVEACLTGYAAAGGRIGAADESAFTGMLLGRLSSTAWELWISCGHRGVNAATQAKYAPIVRDSVVALTELLDAAPTWATWLKA